MSSIQIVLGGASFGLHDSSMFNTAEKAKEALDIYRSFGHSIIDTSRLYPSDKPGTSEEILGQAGLAELIIDTKFLSTPGNHSPENLQKSIDLSLAALGVPKVRILYLHFPDPETPLADVVKGVDAIYKQGKFEKFGVSNYTIEQLTEMLELCDKNGYVKPAVYQGQYNILARKPEEELLPFLRENNIAFYAWTPAAGGVLNKKASTRMNATGPVGNLVRSWYGKPETVKAIDKVVEAAEKHGIPGHTVALNWVLHHSALSGKRGDGMVFGARTVEQVRNTCEALKYGPLPEEVVKLLDDVWSEAREHAPPYTPWGKPDPKLANYLNDRKGENRSTQ